MADRAVRVVLSAAVGPFVNDMSRASRSVQDFEGYLRGAERAARDLGLAGGRIGAQFRGSIGDVDRLAAALRDLRLPPGGLAGTDTMRRQIRDLEEDLARLRREAGRPVPLGPSGGGGRGEPGGGGSRGGFGGVLGGTLVSNTAMMGVFAFGAALKSTIKQTSDFETEINTFGAVTQTTGPKLDEVSKKALQLGADASIAGASAADAAVVMTELAKGGLSVADSMTAAKGSLQLASAGQVSFTRAAEIETSALASFQLGAGEAAHVADTLANTANAARGNIQDFAVGLTYAGTTAHMAGYSLEQTSAILALFAKDGLTASVGGTTLKDVIMRLQTAATSTGASGKALHTLGVEVYDVNGKFNTAQTLADQLGAAHKRLSPMVYASAMAHLFGTRAISGANILAVEGSKNLDTMTTAIHNGAGAAAFSTARMQGLGGSFQNLQNQVETAQVTLGEKFSPALQHVVNAVSAAVPVMVSFLTGPELASAFSKIGTYFQPLVSGAESLISKAWPYVRDFAASVGAGFKTIVGFVKPVVDAIGGFFKTAVSNGSIDRLGGVLTDMGHGFQELMKFISPVGKAIADAIGWFTNLGPVATTAATALIGFKLAKPILTALFNMNPLGIQTLTTSIGQFGKNFRDTMLALQSTGVSRVGAVLGGLAQSAASFGKGLLAAFGGPIGLAIVGITTALAFLPHLFGGNSKAAEQMKTDIENLTATLNAHTAAITDDTKASMADALVKSGVAEQARALGLNLNDLLSAALGSAGGIGKLNDDIAASVGRSVAASDQYRQIKTDLDAAGISAGDLGRAIQSGDFTGVTAKWNAFGRTMAGNTDVTMRLGSEQAAFGQIIADAPAIMDPYNKVLGAVGESSKGLAADQHEVRLKNELLNSSFDDTVRHASAAAGELGKFVPPTTEASKQLAILQQSIAKVADDPAAVTIKDHLKGVADAATEASDNVAWFKIQMDKLNGVSTKLGEVTRAEAAGLREVGKSYREEGDAAKKVADAKAALDKARSGQGQADWQASIDKATAELAIKQDALDKLMSKGLGKGQSQADFDDAVAKAKAVVEKQQAALSKLQATTPKGSPADIQAATRAYVQAQQDQLAATEGTAAAVEKSRVGVEELAISTYRSVAASKGYTAGVTAVVGVYKQAHDAFVKQVVDNRDVSESADHAAKRAEGLAKAIGLVPSRHTIELALSDQGALDKAAEDKKIFDAAAKARNIKFTADTSDALGLLHVWNANVDAMPKRVLTKFDADVATANAAGRGLFEVYSQTTGNWVASFLTPNQAEAKRLAGDLVTQYDRTDGKWIANLTAVDLASLKVAAVQKAIDGMHGKSVELKVLAGYAGLAGSVPVSALRALHATGGPIYGSGAKGVDSVPAMLAPGEHVLTDKEVDRMGGQAAVYAFRRGLMSDQRPRGFAKGGSLGGENVTVKLDTSGFGETIAAIGQTVTKGLANTAKTVAADQARLAAQMAPGSPSGLLGSQDPSAWGWTVGRNIVPFSFNGVSFPSGVASGTESIWSAFLSRLVPLIPGGLRPGEDWGYENRANVNNPSQKSFHAYGLALDVNSSENPNMPGTRGPAGSGMYQVPASADSLARQYNMLWGGEWGDAMHFELHQRPGGFAAAQASSGASGAYTGGAGASTGAGVQQWAGLAATALAMTGQYSATHLAEMLHQMDTESSGNPQAINLWDQNARNGIPSKGLMQVIDPTFRTYAMPGFTGNIWDPLSNMLASIRYVLATYNSLDAGYRGVAYAGGGAVHGPGPKGKDSQLAWLAPGEHVLTDKEVAKMGGHQAVYAFRQGLMGAMPHLASGGPWPLPLTNQMVMGLPAANYGPRLSGVYSAYATADQAGGGLYTQASQDATSQHAALVSYIQVAATYKAAVGSAARIAAYQNVITAQLALDAATKTANASLNVAQSFSRVRRSILPLLAEQAKLANSYDATVAQLSNAQQTLTGLQQSRASTVSNVQGTLSGYDSGILGHQQQRGTYDSIMRGQQFDLGKIAQFTQELRGLKARGLNASTLSQIASAGVDGGGITAAALYKASAAQIKQLNGVTNAIQAWSFSGGSTVGAAMFDKQIEGQQKLVTQLVRNEVRIDHALGRLAPTIGLAVNQALAGWKVQIDPQGIARLVRIGERALGIRV